MGNNGALGRRGEDIALEFLSGRGYRFVARNWRCRHAELDIVVEDGNCLRIVEVKTRMHGSIAPIENVGSDKIKMIIRATDSFVRRYNIEKEVVFDIISVVIDNEGYTVEYTPEAFNILTKK